MKRHEAIRNSGSTDLKRKQVQTELNRPPIRSVHGGQRGR